MSISIVLAVHGFKEHLQTQELTEKTRQVYAYVLRYIQRYLYRKHINDVSAVDQSCIIHYSDYIHSLPLAKGTRRKHISVLRLFVHYCHASGFMLVNPFDRLPIVVSGEEEERVVFSEEEITAFLDTLPSEGCIAVRNKSIFELMYGTGMRVNEVVGLNLEDVDIDRGEVRILYGKGGKQRIVPLCGRARDMMKQWLTCYRSSWENTMRALYVSSQGKRLHVSAVPRAFKEHLATMPYPDRGFVLHSLRHSCATHLLAHGADIRYIQELLGHTSIETTAQYTKQEKTRLKIIHKMYHPRENELYEDEGE